jgi:hypothetical protein
MKTLYDVDNEIRLKMLSELNISKSKGNCNLHR